MFVYARYFGGWTPLGQNEAFQCLSMNDIWEAGSVSFRRKISNVCLRTIFWRLDPSRSDGRCPLSMSKKMSNVCLCIKFGRLVPSRSEGRYPMFVYIRSSGGLILLGQKEDVQCLCIKFVRLVLSRSEGRCPMFVYVRNLGGWILLGQKEDVQCLSMYEVWKAFSVSVRRKMYLRDMRS
jgi:hypothetical protein